MIAKEYRVGDVYWSASIKYFSNEETIGNFVTVLEAEDSVTDFLSWLTPRENENAVTWITPYMVTSVSEDGQIEAAKSLQGVTDAH